jgi:hypothetical protein
LSVSDLGSRGVDALRARSKLECSVCTVWVPRSSPLDARLNYHMGSRHMHP